MPDNTSPVQRIVRGAAQNLGSVYCARILNWGATIFLMRKLAEEDFGHLAVAVSIFTLVTSLRKLGLHTALLHNYDQLEELVPTHFVLNFGLGALSTMAVVGVAFLYASPGNVTTALIVFAASDFLRNAMMTSETQLKHELRFGRLALSHASGVVVASLVAIGMALSGKGFWALVMGLHIQSVGYVVIFSALVWMRRPPPLFRLGQFDLERARRLTRFGLWFWIGTIMQALIQQYDRLILAASLSARWVGFYAQAQLFAQIPTGAITHAVVGITGTVYARYQNDRIRLSSAFRRTLRLIVRGTVPLTLILVVEAPHLVRVLVGESWLPLVPVLRWLVVFALCRPLLDDTRALLLSVGNPRTVAGFSAIQAGVVVVLAPILTKGFGAKGTAVTADIASVVGLALAGRAASRYVDIPWTRAIVVPLVAAAAALTIRLGCDGLLRNLPVGTAVFAGSATLGVSYVVALIAMEGRELKEELMRLWSAFGDRSQADSDAHGEAPRE